MSLRFGVRQAVFSDGAIMKMALYVMLLLSLGDLTNVGRWLGVSLGCVGRFCMII